MNHLMPLRTRLIRPRRCHLLNITDGVRPAKGKVLHEKLSRRTRRSLGTFATGAREEKVGSLLGANQSLNFGLQPQLERADLDKADQPGSDDAVIGGAGATCPDRSCVRVVQTS